MAGRDEGLDRLLDLHGILAEVGGGYWVKIEVWRVPPEHDRPHGIAYTLTLHEPDGRRIFGIDNAHLVRPLRGPARRSRPWRNHLHRGETVRPYVYRDADTLIDDFWREVAAILKQAGIE
ncbi:MAG: DUF6516 family protein [Hyphomicrobiales bacterium]|nr:DUF6516 family protein [Hyphomicrobiales bacterium]